MKAPELSLRDILIFLLAYIAFSLGVLIPLVMLNHFNLLAGWQMFLLLCATVFGGGVMTHTVFRAAYRTHRQQPRKPKENDNEEG